MSYLTPIAPVATLTPVANGPNTLVVQVSEDAWLGDAQFTVSVDGTRVGGVQTATALHGSGATQSIALAGQFGTGQHQVAIGFINDAYGGTASTDRNLYVQSVSIDGFRSTTPPVTMLSSGTSTFNVQVGAAPISTTTLAVRLSEDAWMGDAQFVVSLDGRALGAAQAVTALHASGQTQSFSFSGSFGAGSHNLAVSFLNDAYGGTPTTDRNLYIAGISVNNVAVPGSTVTMLSAGTSNFALVLPS